MILIFDNMLCLVIEKLEHLGPEPHYKVCFKNKLGAVAVQPSGRVVGYEEEVEEYENMKNKYIHYFTTLKYLECFDGEFLSRECGPAYICSEKHKTDIMYDYYYEEYRENGKKHRKNWPAVTELWGGHEERETKEYWINGQKIPKPFFIYENYKQ